MKKRKKRRRRRRRRRRRNEDGGRKERSERGRGIGKRRRGESRQLYHLHSPAVGLPGFHGNQHHREDTPNLARLHPQRPTRGVNPAG